MPRTAPYFSLTRLSHGRFILLSLVGALLLSALFVFIAYQRYRAQELMDLDYAATGLVTSLVKIYNNDRAQFNVISQRLTEDTLLKGAIFYDAQGTRLVSLGDISERSLHNAQALSRKTQTHYEKPHENYQLWNPQQLGQPYWVLARLESDLLDMSFSEFLQQNGTLLIFNALLILLFIGLLLRMMSSRALFQLRQLALFPEQNTQPILRIHEEGQLLYANDASHALLKEWGITVQERVPDAWKSLVKSALRLNKNEELEINIENQTYLMQCIPILSEKYVNLYGVNITQRKKYEQELTFVAKHDPITRFARRALLDDRLQQLLKVSERKGKMAAVLTIILWKSKEILLNYGQTFGDQLYQKIAKRMTENAPKRASMARFDDEQFAVILDDFDDIAFAEKAAQRLLHAFSQPFIVNDQSILLPINIGIAIYPTHGKDTQDLIQKSHLSAYHSQSEGVWRYRLPHGDFDTDLRGNSKKFYELTKAIENNELVLHYQPQFDLKQKKFTGLEALIRWQHPRLGWLLPDDFIPIAEESGYIIEIGHWILKQACEDLHFLKKQGMNDLKVSVNLSAKQLLLSDVFSTIKELLEKHALPATLLTLEVTESLLIYDINQAIEKLNALCQLGIQISIDDFGTGYSSFNYLKQLPASEVKLDRSFVSNLLSEEQDAHLIEGIIQLSHKLQLTVVAEGVETKEQADYLRKIDCNTIQGYYLSKPASLETILSLIKSFSV